jgi:hypothetical protein
MANRPLAALEKTYWQQKGPYLGRLAGKRGVGAGKKAFYFALFHVLLVFFFRRLLSDSILRILEGSQKNRAKKPTVGFCFSEVVT